MSFSQSTESLILHETHSQLTLDTDSVHVLFLAKSIIQSHLNVILRFNSPINYYANCCINNELAWNMNKTEKEYLHISAATQHTQLNNWPHIYFAAVGYFYNTV